MTGPGRRGARAIAALGLVAACGRTPSGSTERGAGSAERGPAPALDAIAPGLTSALVLRGGEVVREAYFGGADAGTLHDTRSAMKSVTALLVGLAIADGHLPSVAAPAFGYLAELAPFAHDGPVKQAITIEDLLTMSSALACDDDDPDSPGNEEGMYPQRAWARWAVDLPLDPTYARGEDGRGRYAYCTAGSFLLGQIVERASGVPLDRYAADRLLGPLGITAARWPRSPSGEVMAGGGLRLRTRDLARLGWMIRQGGQLDGRQIVPAAWLAAALRPHRRASPVAEYGYQFWRRDFRTACGTSSGWFMSGNGGNHVVILPDLDAVVVVTRTSYNRRGMHDETRRLVEEHLIAELPCARRPG